MSAEQPRIYLVPEQNYGELKEQLTRLQRRAKKLNAEAIVLNELSYVDYPGYHLGDFGNRRLVFLRPEADPANTFRDRWEPATEVKRVYSITVTGPAPVLNGYQFVGAVDVIRDDQGKVVGNMVRTLPDQEMPEIYRLAEPHCDHCGVKRQWKSMYVVAHEDGSHSQVGRQCLKDFTGHKSPEHFAAQAELLMTLGGLLSSAEEDWDDDDEGRERGSRKHSRFSVKLLLGMTATIIRTDGWKSKKAAMDTGGSSTADNLRQWLYARGTDLDKLNAYYAALPEDATLADETLDWLGTLAERAESLNDYEHNLSLFALAGSVEDKVFGFVASAIPAYTRTKDKRLYAEKELLVSNWLSEIGKRSEFILTLVSKTYRDSDFGVQTRCKYHDDIGNVVIWWASTDVELEEGARLRAKATVKKHEEFQGIKQTLVSRLAVVEVLPAKAGN